MKSFGQNKRVDLVAGSEKILRVHHRNMVHARYLQHSLNNLDAVCKRNLNRVQQEIYNVYYSEYLPLIESTKKINDQHTTIRRGAKKFGLAGDGRVKQKCMFPDLNISTQSSCNSFSTVSALSRLSGDIVPLPSIFDKSGKRKIIDRAENQEPTLIPLSFILKLPEEERPNFVRKWKEDFERSCPSVVSRSERNTSPNIDNDRLNMIKSAIALSSQPPPNIDDSKKNRKLRRSFLVNLRKESRAVWTDNVLKGIKECGNKRKPSMAKQNSVVVRNNSAKSVTSSLAANTIGEDKGSDDGDDESIFKKLSSARKSAIAMVPQSEKETLHRFKGSVFHNIPSSSDEDSYYSSTPDIFSEIDEEPSSFEDSEYDGSSYSSGTGSSYSEYSDDDFSLTEDEI